VCTLSFLLNVSSRSRVSSGSRYGLTAKDLERLFQ